MLTGFSAQKLFAKSSNPLWKILAISDDVTNCTHHLWLPNGHSYGLGADLNHLRTSSIRLTSVRIGMGPLSRQRDLIAAIEHHMGEIMLCSDRGIAPVLESKGR